LGTSSIPLVLDELGLKLGLDNRWFGLLKAGGEFYQGRRERVAS